MLPSSQRLNLGQFKMVMEKGRVTHSSIFLLRYVKDDSFNGTRIAAVVPQKVTKKAVIRNRTRRRMYEAVRPIRDLLVSNTHVIIFAKSGSLVADLEAMRNEAKSVFVKAGLLK